jgi:hypothetical protein
MAIFSIKYRDTRPVLEVALKNPDGSAHDLTGTTAWKLHIRLSSSTVMTRDLVKQGLDTAGVLRYTWVSTDWNAGSLPSVPAHSVKEFPMEYEVLAGTVRLTFPNDGYDTLQIRGDLA